MGFLPANVDELDIEISRGRITDVPLTLDDTPGDMSFWVGGSLEDLDDLTGATEVVGVAVGNVVTFTFPAQSEARQALRLEHDGDIVTAGHLVTATRGRRRGQAAYTATLGGVSGELSMVGGSPSVAADLAALPSLESGFFSEVDTTTTPGSALVHGRRYSPTVVALWSGTTETALAAALTVPADALEVGDSLDFEIGGIFFNNSGSNRTADVKLKWAGTTIATWTTPNIPISASLYRRIVIRGTIATYTSSGTKVNVFGGEATLATLDTSAPIISSAPVAGTEIAADLSASADLTATVTLSANNGAYLFVPGYIYFTPYRAG